jgi:uncharacterized protein YlaI
MQRIIRSREGYEESNTACPWCGHEHDVNVLRKIFERSNNVCTMHTTCDECDKRVRLQRHKLGHFSFYKYIDYKKRRLIKSGHVPVPRNGTQDYA